MPNLSATGYNHWQLCNRFFYWTDVLHYERVKDEGPRRFGKMFHAGLEAWWTAMDGGDTPWRDADAALVVAMQAIAENAKHVATDPFEVARAEVLLQAYHFRYFRLDFESPFNNSSGVEVAFKVPMLGPNGTEVPNWFVTGRKDAIKLFNNDKRKRPVEHKTTSAEIHGAADYWERLKIDTQASIYVDAAQRLGIDVDRIMYDVIRKPEQRPKKKTPDEKRKMTKGKGCVHCGGKKDQPGTGRIMIRTKVDGDGRLLPAPKDVESACTSCTGTGWNEAPKLYSKQRDHDEDAAEFKDRVAEEIMEDPNSFFRQGDIPRSTEQLLESRHDLFHTAGQIDAAFAMARLATEGEPNPMHQTKAMQCFPRNTQSCLTVYNARCDFFEACTGAADPRFSSLYRIRPREEKKP